MALAELADIVPSFACPRCRSAVGEDAAGFSCRAPSCELNAPGSFPLVDRWPALVDFERSVVDADEIRRAPTGNVNRLAIERLPRTLRPLWKPRNRVAEMNTRVLLELCGTEAPTLLVVGGGAIGNGVEALYTAPGPRVIAFDIYGTPYVQFVADAHRIPLADGSVDAVVIQAVLQQLLDPNEVVAEIHRVLRPGGLVYAETPFLQQVAYSGPYDFVRYTASGHRYLFRSFDEVAAGPVAGPGTQVLTSIDHLVRALTRSQLAGKLARAVFFWLRLLDRAVPVSFAMDNASAYYFLGRRSEHTLSPDQIVAYYRGAHGGPGGIST